MLKSRDHCPLLQDWIVSIAIVWTPHAMSKSLSFLNAPRAVSKLSDYQLISSMTKVFVKARALLLLCCQTSTSFGSFDFCGWVSPSQMSCHRSLKTGVCFDFLDHSSQVSLPENVNDRHKGMHDIKKRKQNCSFIVFKSIQKMLWNKPSRLENTPLFLRQST